MDNDMEIRLISREIFNYYDVFDIEYCNEIAKKLYDYGVRIYMFNVETRIGVWEIVSYVIKRNLPNVIVFDKKNYSKNTNSNKINRLKKMRSKKKVRGGNDARIARSGDC